MPEEIMTKDMRESLNDQFNELTVRIVQKIAKLARRSGHISTRLEARLLRDSVPRNDKIAGCRKTLEGAYAPSNAETAAASS
jgi:hypothetical protein